MSWLLCLLSCRLSATSCGDAVSYALPLGFLTMMTSSSSRGVLW